MAADWPGRLFAGLCSIALLLFSSAAAQESKPIDRHALVTRHNPHNEKIDPLEPLTVGNGKFAFTADITGLQSFPEAYETGIPLSTQSEWGWHSFPNPKGYKLTDALHDYDTYGRQVPYASNQDSEAGAWLRESPHRLGLGRIGCEFTKRDGSKVSVKDIEKVSQQLDLWTGILSSQFEVDGEPVEVTTICHPSRDLLDVRVKSPLISEGRLSVALRFAYGSHQFGKAPDDWSQPGKHMTRLVPLAGNEFRLVRTLDADFYVVQGCYSKGGVFKEIAPHQFQLTPTKETDEFKFHVEFSPRGVSNSRQTVADFQTVTAAHWQDFWTTGGAIELVDSTDPRAEELERRIVLSQYLMAVQCAGSAPPQETGLTFNSWFGKSHLEMHWWHAVHWALWNRLKLLERSLGWYDKVLPLARETAKRQGYSGARWPKMVGPDGRDSPSKVGVFLLWQQPHPIYYAELCYRQKPTPETLDHYREIVFSTADFMASYAHWDPKAKHYNLGPPMIPAQEHYDAKKTFNPPYELEYWHWALGIAQQWRERLGMPRDENWQKVIDGLAPPPMTDGVYDTAEGVWVDTDHPSHLMAMGFLPGERIDADVMRRTLKRVMKSWNWDTTWGWDYPMIAMTAARVGEPETAIDALLLDVPKNRYLANGHNHQDDRLPIYLPGNGGLLTAVAMMAAGWDGAPDRHAPGFPDNGKWQVRWEDLNKLP